MSETPRFIEVGDFDDVPSPVPIFVTRNRPDRLHGNAMKKALAADPTYAAQLRAELTAEDAVDELAVLDRYEQSIKSP
ncbi:UNVERIFIED_ORG: hypothetical protein J2W16_004402 [Pseudomonas cremoricolorata]|uniref:hypothetical protein n=1 Tax=Pseudomonas sp. DE0157 TaxID=2584952 RepID=UPI00119F054B|nr:hypothetical protein [Pseudomonas sp. DE0157]MDP9666639.1 hypothetical protein [Pseudomonas cremoricolorata]